MSMRQSPNISRHELAVILEAKEDYFFGAAFTAARDQFRSEDGVDLRPIPGTGTYTAATPEQSHKRAKKDVVAAKRKLTRSKQKAALATKSEDPKVAASAQRLADRVEYFTSRVASAPPKTNPFDNLKK